MLIPPLQKSLERVSIQRLCSGNSKIMESVSPSEPHDKTPPMSPRITSGELQPFLILLIPRPVSDVILSILLDGKPLHDCMSFDRTHSDSDIKLHDWLGSRNTAGTTPRSC